MSTHTEPTASGDHSPLDPDILEILVCPETGGPLEQVTLPEAIRHRLADKYREHFRDEEPVVEVGLLSSSAKLVYPVVSEIPIMLVDEALPASVLDGGPGDAD